MAHDPWFKAYSAEVLTDQKMDAIPPEAEGLLWRMWCVCNLRGSIPADPEEIARLTCRKPCYVSCYVSYTLPFFDLRDGQLFSHRMEREKEKSESARRSRSFRKDVQLEERGTNRTTKRTSERGTKISEVRDQIEELTLIASSDKDRSPQEETVFDLPLITGTEYGVPQSLFDEYVRAYPAISVMAELGKMRTWLLSNPKNKKTRQGITRFMCSWLSRAQNTAPVISRTTPKLEQSETPSQYQARLEREAMASQ